MVPDSARPLLLIRVHCKPLQSKTGTFSIRRLLILGSLATQVYLIKSSQCGFLTACKPTSPGAVRRAREASGYSWEGVEGVEGVEGMWSKRKRSVSCTSGPASSMQAYKKHIFCQLERPLSRSCFSSRPAGQGGEHGGPWQGALQEAALPPKVPKPPLSELLKAAGFTDAAAATTAVQVANQLTHFTRLGVRVGAQPLRHLGLKICVCIYIYIY